MKVLVTGGKGQLSYQIKSIVKRKKSDIGLLKDELKNCEWKFLDHDEFDITNYDQIDSYIESFRPNIIINCAAYTNVDKCEIDVETAFKVNAIGPKNLAVISQKYNIKLLHISTDYVFNGKGVEPIREYEITDPVSIYGKTKLLGEQYIREFCNRYFIVRTSWLYGEEGKNFVYTIRNLGKEKGYLEVVDDQIGNPTYAEDLAYHILEIILTNEYGIYHCTGKGECSWYEFACKIIEYSGIECTVNSVNSGKISRLAKRPEYSSLDNMMLRITVGDNMRNWQEALKSFIDKLNNTI